MVGMNVFRICADVSHTISKCILIWAIHSNKSAEGVSLITQALYAVVFCTRYWDLFSADPESNHFSLWNFVLKIFYIASSFYIIFIMMKLYPRTREQERSWKLGASCLAFATILGPILAPIACALDTHCHSNTLFRFSWTFSIILESVCVIPQLLLLRQTTVPTVIDSGYILFLGAYRALYILNWIFRYAHHSHPEWIAVTFGIIQTALYIDFAWVYWTRQRVKLRNGGVVDSDDLSRGFLVGKILGRGEVGVEDEDVEDHPAGHNGILNVGKKRGGGRWGKRGVSVSADADNEEYSSAASPTHDQPEGQRTSQPKSAASRTEDDSMAAFVDDEDDDEHETEEQQQQQQPFLSESQQEWSTQSK